MNVIEVQVLNRVCSMLNGNFQGICENYDYQIHFTFSEDWNPKKEQTICRICYKGQYIDIPFSGNTVNLPGIKNAKEIEIGVYTKTLATTPLRLPMIPSILSKNGVVTDGGSGGNDDEVIYF